MSRSVYHMTGGVEGFPRVSGDEPDTSGQSGGENRFSPRERG